MFKKVILAFLTHLPLIFLVILFSVLMGKLVTSQGKLFEIIIHEDKIKVLEKE